MKSDHPVGSPVTVHGQGEGTVAARDDAQGRYRILLTDGRAVTVDESQVAPARAIAGTQKPPPVLDKMRRGPMLRERAK